MTQQKNKNLTFFHQLSKFYPTISNLLIYLGGFLNGANDLSDGGLCFLYLHDVDQKYYENFKKLILDLKKEFNFVSTNEAMDLIKNEHMVGKKFLHLSFDDGFENNFKAANFLKENKIPATLFIITNFIDKKFEDLDFYFKEIIKEKKSLDWSQIKEMQSWGMEIGSHSCNHFNFSQLDNEETFKEMKESKEKLEGKVGCLVDSFSFPYGRLTDFKKNDLQAAKQSGYKFIFTTELKIYKNRKDLGEYICRYGIEPYLTSKAVKILINGLLKRLR